MKKILLLGTLLLVFCLTTGTASAWVSFRFGPPVVIGPPVVTAPPPAYYPYPYAYSYPYGYYGPGYYGYYGYGARVPGYWGGGWTHHGWGRAWHRGHWAYRR